MRKTGVAFLYLLGIVLLIGGLFMIARLLPSHQILEERGLDRAILRREIPYFEFYIYDEVYLNESLPADELLRDLFRGMMGFDPGEPLTLVGAEIPYFGRNGGRRVDVRFSAGLVGGQGAPPDSPDGGDEDREKTGGGQADTGGEVGSPPPEGAGEEGAALPEPEGDPGGGPPGSGSGRVDREEGKEGEVPKDGGSHSHVMDGEGERGEGGSPGWASPAAGAEEAGPRVAIYHTHTSESYLPSSGQKRVMDEDGGRGDVVGVGEELASRLEDYGIGVVHRRDIHDHYPWYKSYARSEETLRGLVGDYPSLEMILDIHRDAVKVSSQEITTTRIYGQRAARILIIVGTDRLGLEHPEWRENLAFARELEETLEEMYPGLVRGVSVRPERFNQHLSPRSLLLEIGDVQSTREEALRSAGFLAEAISRMLQG